jgi:hypothetical protein
MKISQKAIIERKKNGGSRKHKRSAARIMAANMA